MAEASRFFNAVDGDRVYSAADWAEYFASFIGNGVFGSPITNLQVSPGDGMNVSVAAGILLNDIHHKWDSREGAE